MLHRTFCLRPVPKSVSKLFPRASRPEASAWHTHRCWPGRWPPTAVLQQHLHGASTFCSWAYAIQSSNQHSFQKTKCNCHWLNLIGSSSSVDPMQLLDTILYWQWVNHNYRLRTGCIFNYCSYYLAARWRMWIFVPLQTTICSWSSLEEPQKCRWHFMDVSTSSTFAYIYNITTKYKWDFMLDASTDSTYTTTKCKWGFDMNNLPNNLGTLQNEWNYKQIGTSDFFVQNEHWVAICTLAQVLPFL